MPDRLRRMTSEAQHSTAQPLSSKSETHAADLQVWGWARDRKPRPIVIDREPEDPTDTAKLIVATLHSTCLCRLPNDSRHPPGLEPFSKLSQSHPHNTASGRLRRSMNKVLCEYGGGQEAVSC